MTHRIIGVAAIVLPLAGATAVLAEARPSFDCRRASEPVQQLICANEDLAASERGVSERLKSLAEDLTRQSFEAVAATQAPWERFVQAMCIAAKDPADRQAATVCLIERYSERLTDIQVPIAAAGDLRLEGRMRFRADEGTGLREEDVYPHLAAPRAAAAPFNAHVAKELRLDRPLVASRAKISPPAGSRPDWTSYHRRGFEIAHASRQFLSLPVFEEWLIASADGGQARRTLNWNLERNRPLRFEDLFRPGADWRPAVTAAARESLQRQLELDPGSAEPAPDAVTRIATRIENWTFRPGEAVIHFSPGTIASEIDGGFDVDLPYDELTRYLGAAIQLPARDSSDEAPP